jgi:hypothetical protein
MGSVAARRRAHGWQSSFVRLASDYAQPVLQDGL